MLRLRFAPRSMTCVCEMTGTPRRLPCAGKMPTLPVGAACSAGLPCPTLLREHHFAPLPMTRFQFARRWALRHLLISVAVGLATAVFVFGVLYAWPWRAMLGVNLIFILILVVDVCCGPLLTLILSAPHKSRREHIIDFSLIGAIQVAALVYGLYAVWVARPVALSFEVDRLVVVTANEVQEDQLPQAPPGLRHLPGAGGRLLHVTIREPRGPDEMLKSIDLGMSGISPSMRPAWWLPWQQALPEMRQKALPLAELIQRRPKKRQLLQQAAAKTGLPVEQLLYLPLTSPHTLNWTAILDQDLAVVGYAPVDAFHDRS